LPGRGDYIIYHGDLSVAENSLIAESLIKNVFSRIPFECIIAGKNPPRAIVNKAYESKNIRIIPNPDTGEMNDLIRNAHINLLPSLTNNGFKMKLLIALFTGRHCLVNGISAENFPDKSVFQIADTNEQLIDKINFLMTQEFTMEMIATRKKVIEKDFSNERNARKLAEVIFG
jgi:glycosyltransferase involved in cell wall biosynthesis